MTKITLKTGKTYHGFWNGNIYNGTIYINRPTNGHIEITDENGTFGSPRNSIKINVSDVVSGLNSQMPKSTGVWMSEMNKIENNN